MAKLLMIQGVSSNSGKSVITKALCRYYYNLGINVTTFKPVLVCVDEVTSNGISTDIRLDASMKACKQKIGLHNNPIQIRPETNDNLNNPISPVSITIENCDRFQMSMLGRDTPLFNRLTEDQIKQIKESIIKNLTILSQKFDLIIIEGAGNPTDLQENDLTNHFLAENFQIETILVTKISTGGAVASLLGTYELLTTSIKNTVSGYILNDFIDGEEVVHSFKELIYQKTQLPCLGVFPHIWSDIKNLPDEQQIERLESAVKAHLDISFLESKVGI